MKKLALSHQDILVGGRSTLPHHLVAKIFFTLGLCVYYKTTILNSKPRWNIMCTKWTHPKYESHWSTEAHITRWNEFTGSHVVEFIHSSLSDHFSKHASISDAAHQALLAYHGKHYEERKNSKQKYLPCRPPGTSQCVMADPYLEKNEQLKEMALTIQVMHQKLEDSQLELAEVRQHYEEKSWWVT